MTPNTEYKLGLTNSSAAMIRDFLRTDVETLRRELAQLARQHEQMGKVIERLSVFIEENIADVTLDLLDTNVRSGADKTIVIINDETPPVDLPQLVDSRHAHPTTGPPA
jgi:hypothetical protein